MSNLTAKHCVPCEGGTPPMTDQEIDKYLAEAGGDWEHVLGLVHKIKKEFRFKNFTEAMIFVNKIANLAESEGHHPDIFISWNKVRLELFTHAIHGLSENDFILAAKIDKL
jgi:4a-hydroxytetrahydrobiopterin dehydratase